jgi:hypothetical protein
MLLMAGGGASAQNAPPSPQFCSLSHRMRHNAGLDGIPGGPGLNGTDDIVYYSGQGMGGVINSSVEVDPSQFAQPHCLGAKDVTP